MARSGSPYSTPRDANRVPLLVAASTADGVTPVVLEADPTTHALVIEATFAAIALPSTIRNNQQTVTTSAVALPSGALTQGVILEALSTNTISIFVGGVGVTTSTGTELQPGASTSVAVNNTNVIFVICATGSPVITWIGS